MRVTEPATTTAAALGVKSIGLYTVAGILAGVVAMALTLPKTTKEFAARLVVTVITSIMVGPFTVDLVKAYLPFIQLTTRSEYALAFLTGVPAWLIWSWVINRLEAGQDATVGEAYEIVRKIRGGK